MITNITHPHCIVRNRLLCLGLLADDRIIDLLTDFGTMDKVWVWRKCGTISTLNRIYSIIHTYIAQDIAMTDQG